MFNRDSVKRLGDKSPLHAIQMELQQGYALSPVEAQVLAQRLQQLVDEQTGYTRNLGQITYQAIDIDEPPGKPLEGCRKVAVQLTLFDQADAEVLAREGPVGLRRARVYRLVNEALMQGASLRQAPLGFARDRQDRRALGRAVSWVAVSSRISGNLSLLKEGIYDTVSIGSAKSPGRRLYRRTLEYADCECFYRHILHSHLPRLLVQRNPVEVSVGKFHSEGD